MKAVAIWSLVLGLFALLTLPAFMAVVLTGDRLVIVAALLIGWVGGALLLHDKIERTLIRLQ